MQAISAGHEKTLEAAKLILENGGNTFDAAIAAAFVMFITEPCMASAGAGGFAMVHTAEKGVEMLDFFTQTPRHKKDLEQRDFYPIEVDFGTEIETFHVGLASSATPGMIKGLFELHRKYASIPMKELLSPTRALAKSGVTVNEFQYLDMGLLEAILAVDPSMKDVFFKDSQRLQLGDNLQMPNLHSFLDFIVDEGDRGFYHGEISETISQACKARGGYLTREDFQNYKAIWRKPLHFNYNNQNIYLPNGPSLGGALFTLALNEYSKDKNWPRAIHKVRKDYFDASSIQIGMDDTFGENIYQAKGGTIASKGTSHFNILDNKGNGIAFTCSLGEGSGYFIPGTDMQMNNMLGESFLLPDGFHSWEEDTRLNSMMTPTLMTDQQGKLNFLGGSGGAGRIPFMIAQVIENLNKGMDLKTATANARVHVQDGVLHAEPNADIEGKPSELGIHRWESDSLFFGGVHSIFTSNDNRIQAEGDPRRFGVGLVF